MRLLVYNIENEILQKLRDKELYITDIAYDLEDTVYHLQVRFYNLVIIDEDNLENCLKLLKSYYDLNTAFIVIAKDVDKEFEIKCLKNGAICVLQKPLCLELLMAKIESIHRENFSKSIIYKEYFKIDREFKEIMALDKKELNIKGKACDVLTYLVQNKHRPPISKDELIYALWDDPELVCNNVIEVNINQIRSKFKKELKIDPIDTIRSKGYKLKI